MQQFNFSNKVWSAGSWQVLCLTQSRFWATWKQLEKCRLRSWLTRTKLYANPGWIICVMEDKKRKPTPKTFNQLKTQNQNTVSIQITCNPRRHSLSAAAGSSPAEARTPCGPPRAPAGLLGALRGRGLAWCGLSGRAEPRRHSEPCGHGLLYRCPGIWQGKQKANV